MNEPANRHRPTSTATLWAVGIVGGIVVAIAAFLGGGDDAEQTRQAATNFGIWSIRPLVVGALIAGGWSALKRRPGPR
jgi:hypothetical protein